MPYLLLILGLILAALTFARYFIKADAGELRDVFRKVFFISYIFILLFFAVTGRIIIAIILVFLTIPFIISYYREKNIKAKALPPHDEVIENESEQNDD